MQEAEGRADEDVCARWMRHGPQARLPTPGTNRKRSIFGALDLTTGRWLSHVDARRRSAEFR
ncbi:MAG: hypothetical protein LC769_10640, partial [Chloroflexi bacterium]|nr:hypothetical protein [Chloroflexota bacterium]